MFSYGQYCPVAKSAEILGDRWTLLIVRELIHGDHRFNEIHRHLPGISRSVLADRLKRLEDAGVIERRATSDPRVSDYYLTPVGEDLRTVVVALGSWGARWVIHDPTPREADPDLVVLWFTRHIHEAELPAKRVVVEFDVRAGRRRRLYWVVMKRGDVSLCVEHPGFEPDLVLRTDSVTLFKIYMGRSSWPDAIRDQKVDVDGSRQHVRSLPTWFSGSIFASIVRSRS